MSGKFVILFHDGCGEAHYDLMLEAADHLDTWQFKNFPSGGAECKKLPPHRKAYLTYEGPVSGNRGAVSRADEGLCDVTQMNDGLRVKLGGKKIAGEFLLRELTGDMWSFNAIS